MEMLFEVVEDGFNLWPASKELSLAFGHELLLLGVMRWGQDTRAEGTPYLLVQWYAAVAAITNGDAGMLVHERGNSSAVVNVSTRERDGAELAVVVDGRMKLKTIVLTLPVMPGTGITPGHAVPPSPDELADGQHGSIHEAKRCFAFEEAAKQLPQHRIYPVAVFEKVLVVR